jgi:hypothetical protein
MQLGMAHQKQTITLLSCCQSTLGHASKQPNTCADVEVVELMSNQTHKYIKIELANFHESKPCRNYDIPFSVASARLKSQLRVRILRLLLARMLLATGRTRIKLHRTAT